MPDVRNPYAPPTAAVADPMEQAHGDGADAFIPNGRRVSARHGAKWIGDAWRLFRARPGRWLVASFLIMLMHFVIGRIPVANAGSMLIWPFTSAGVVLASDLQRRTGTFSLAAICAGFRKPAPMLIICVIALLSVVALYASYTIVLGSDAANQIVLKMGRAHATTPVPPGRMLFAMLLYGVLAFPITAATYLAIPLVMLRGLGVGSAIKMSFISSIKNLLPGIVFMVCATVFVTLSIVPLGLGLLISIPTLLIANYTVYRDIFPDSR